MYSKIKVAACLCIGLIAGMLSSHKCLAQTITTYTSDSLKSGTAKDVLVSFVQLAVNNLTGTNKEFRFTTNPYEFYKKIDPEIGIDRRYNKWTLLRRTNIGFGLKLDSNFKYNGLTSGITVAVIDKTDPTTSSWYADAIKGIPVYLQLVRLQKELERRAESEYPNHNFRKNPSDSADYKAFRTWRKDRDDYLSSQVKYKDITPPQLKGWVDEIIKDSALNEIKTINSYDTATFKLGYIANLNKYKSQLKKAAILTFGVNDTTYKDNLKLASLNFFGEFNKGVFDPKPGRNNFEINIKAAITSPMIRYRPPATSSAGYLMAH